MGTDAHAIRLLILDDSQNHAERLVSILRNAGHATRAHRVTSREDLQESLQQTWDLCLSCPETSYITAQEACQLISQAHDIPFIMLAEQVDTDARLLAMRSGMQDTVPAAAESLLTLVVKRELTNLSARRQRRIAEQALRETEKRCQLLLDSSVDAIAYVLDGMHIYANRAYSQLFGYDDADDLAAEPMVGLIATRDQETFKDFLRHYASRGDQSELRCTARDSEGKEFPIMLSFSPANYDGEPCTQVVIRAETASAEFEEKLKAMASHDLVTGLFNRSWFQEQLDGISEQAVHNSQPSTLAYLSIDNFNSLQSEIGIGGADLILADLAQILRQFFPEGTLLARFSDDACSVLIEGKEPDAVTAALGNLLRQIEGHLFEANGRTIQITTSIGVACISETHPEPTLAIERAHRLAEQVSQAGGNAIKVFNPLEELEQLANRGNLIALIRHTLKTDGFSLQFQPIISLRGDSSEHYETILRLFNSQGEQIPDAEFQAAALESGLAIDIDRWLITRAVTRLAEHRSSKGADTRLLVSLSSASLQDPEIVQWISALLKEHRLSADVLIFQFNDAEANSYLKHAKVLVEALHSIHARIALSHFGGALNPYAILRHLPVDYVKIDDAFSQDLSTPEAVEQLREMVATLHNQGKLTIVSNVSSATMMPTLWQAGINYIQGDYLQPPADSMDFNFSGE
ncbi:response regulator receiver modulated diguanylate cyclase/phosphodiesterase [Pseudomonas saudimassiliensis]|uniref:Response regulator receiver modulated diguanylate cyclase/phosphodiesterase n=1 Tax=Pseudomonas saudimassiliensis TaxID=1461581 RepID=A0A078MHU3_9PSED|nr:EAL domain-containing protein [Pseudomonas saudimassiliensis]CEA05890.1 response regulator receiver modulated diguanylate cyclase/phosphodiesterase [Pseudomonas saudimassiliensis]CEF27378.1 response regulator receiver modulated diguanylate cyclase/phosphodiesterase [Pseudomonas saudimassiliensis]